MRQKNIIKIIGTTLTAAVLMLLSACSATTQRASAANAYIVKNGKPSSVIVASSQEPFVKNAIAELQYHLKRASGVTLKVVAKKDASKLPDGSVRIIVGDKKNASKIKGEYSIRSNEDTLTFMGDGGQSDALQWAVDHYLDSQLGVRWLWPGEAGTYVPKHDTIPLADIDYQGRPSLEKRNFRTQLSKGYEYYQDYRERKYVKRGIPTFLSPTEVQQKVQEAQDWLTRFQSGSRSEYKFGHAFTKWWEKYGKKHPEYFAVPPKDSKFKQPWPKSSRVKLRVGNPAIDDVIIAEWKAAGTPDNWNVSPNDSSGFDTSAASRALDDPPNQDPMIIWRNPKTTNPSKRANLSARYVKFWNRLIAKMRKINPKVTLSSYAYSAYRYPPPPGLKVHSGIVLGFVPSFWAQDGWKQWQKAGAQLYLRPNWWHVGGVAPVLPLHKQGNFFKFAQSHNMIGFDFDSLMGYWGTQGPMYYVIARLSVHPEMSVDDVINEYCSAFGKAAPDIKEYLNYWEQFTTKAGYSSATSTPEYPPNNKNSPVKKLVKEHDLSASYLVQGWQVIPYLYTDDVLAKGYAILDQADRDAATDNDFVKQRIQFLRDGLKHLALTRDVLKLGYIKKRTSEQEKQYLTLSTQLLQMRRSLTPKNVIWGEAGYWAEERRNAPTFSNKTLKEVDQFVAEDG